MTYHGVVLLLSGYQADEAHILRQYEAIVTKYVIFNVAVLALTRLICNYG